MSVEVLALLCAGLGIGFAAGVLVTYLEMVRPLIHKLTHLRYDGFRPVDERPKVVPQPHERFKAVRED